MRGSCDRSGLRTFPARHDAPSPEGLETRPAAPREAASPQTTSSAPRLTIAMRRQSILWTTLTVPALLAFSSRGQELSYHPAAGSSVTRTFETTQNADLEEMSTIVNGNEMDASMMEMEMSNETRTRIVVTDEVGAVADGRPTKLSRTFDTLESNTSSSVSNAMMGEMNNEISGASELEGLKVVFTWDADEGEYTLAFGDDSDGDEDLLEGLAEDMDLRGILPNKEVAEGDTWEVDPQVFIHVFAPGGSIKIEPEDLGEASGMMGGQQNNPSPDKFLGDLDGEVTAEFRGIEDDNGVKVAVIALTVDVSSSKDLSELMKESIEGMDSPMGEMSMEIESFDMEFTFDGEGELRWNLEAGLLHSLLLSGTHEEIMDTSMSMSGGGQDMAIENSLTMGGEMTVEISTTLDG